MRDRPQSGQLFTAISNLARCQEELRREIQAHLDRTNTTGSAFGTELELKWNQIRNFLDRKICIVGQSALSKICRSLGLPSTFEEETLRLASYVPPRFLGLLNEQEEVVRLVCDLVELPAPYAKRARGEIVYRVFGEHADTVLGAARGVQECHVKLRSPELRQKLRTVMAQKDLQQQIETAIASALEETRASRDELKKLVDSLRTRHYGTFEHTAEAMGWSSDAVRNALKGTSGTDTFAKILNAARALSRSTSRPSESGERECDQPKPPPAESRKGPQEGNAPLRTTDLLVAAALGNRTGETVDGISHVLTAETFRPIARVGLLELGRAIALYSSVLRGLLNVGSQLIDEEARQILQAETEPELKELYLSWRAFCFSHPGDLLEALEGQRDAWATDRTKRRKR